MNVRLSLLLLFVVYCSTLPVLFAITRSSAWKESAYLWAKKAGYLAQGVAKK